MSDNIVFQNIPIDLRTPGQYVEIDNSKAVSGLPGQERVILVIGQRLSTGTVPAETLTTISSTGQAVEYFGRGSNLSLMLEALFDVYDGFQVKALAADDLDAGFADVKTLTIGGTTAAGTLALYIGGTAVKIAVSAGAAAATTATSLTAAINAKADLPVTAAASDEDVIITARNKGEVGLIDIRVNFYPEDKLPEGMTVSIVHTTTGSGNPDIADLIAALPDEQYITIIAPWTDSANMTSIEAELVRRWGPLVDKASHLFLALSGTHSELTTWGGNRNSPHVSCWGLKGSMTPDYIRAAVFGGVAEYYGAIDSALPFQTLDLPGVIPPADSDRFTRSERNLLLYSGISTSYETSGGGISVERIITTYQTNQYGLQDVSLLDLCIKWNVDYVRYAIKARIASRYPRHKLADDGVQAGPGQPIVTPVIIEAELKSLEKDLIEAGKIEKLNAKIVRSTADTNRVNAVISPDMINQFMVFAAAVQYIL